mmetsp:Transcript_90275/g.156298  ORF Transcript_90275/g.156298 Transcript_90275/m.156298 type:complete len:209 (-) Transcript_90275:4460-5086(-)
MSMKTTPSDGCPFTAARSVAPSGSVAWLISRLRVFLMWASMFPWTVCGSSMILRMMAVICAVRLEYATDAGSRRSVSRKLKSSSCSANWWEDFVTRTIEVRTRSMVAWSKVQSVSSASPTARSCWLWLLSNKLGVVSSGTNTFFHESSTVAVPPLLLLLLASAPSPSSFASVSPSSLWTRGRFSCLSFSFFWSSTGRSIAADKASKRE